MPFGFCTNSNTVKTSNTFQNDGCDTYTKKLLLEKEQLEATISVLVPKQSNETKHIQTEQ